MKRILCLLVFFCGGLALHAQQTFSAGLLAGITTSQIHGDTYWGWNQAGPLAGMFVSIRPQQKAYFQMELQYTRKGSRKIAQPDKGDLDFFELRMHYIEVPLLLRYNTKKIYYQIGASGGVLFRVREWDDFGEVQPRDFRPYEIAWILGAGYKFNDKFAFDVRTSNSFFPVKKFDIPITYPRFYQNFFNKGMYHNLLSFSVTWRFMSKSADAQ
ncbi:MAG: PorT family protein [Bacteroidia bacterium]|jgi:hypothetical protein|nr:PorT family protein [Bacteroidia bacterium]